MSIKDGDKVSICYVGKLDNGQVFKEVSESEPLDILMGNSEAPPTLEIALKDMAVGDSKKIRVPPEESYGPRTKELVQDLELESFGENVSPKPGMLLSLKVNKDGEEHQVPATVIKIENDLVTVDYNHPLAGHHLTYDLTVVSVVKA